MDSEKKNEHEFHVSPVITRRELAVHWLSHAQEQNGMTLLIDGDAGVGKTFLLRELADAVVEEGRWQVECVRADEIESTEPYSFIERLVASSLIHDWHFVPDAQTNPVLVARECIRRLVTDVKSPGRVVIIDDAQWIDVESQRVLRYMIPRVTRRDILFAFGVRTPHEPGSFGEFLTQLVVGSRIDTLHHVEPLTTREISALALDRLGVGISEHASQRVFDTTGGAFHNVDGILSALTTAEIMQLHLAWDIPLKTVAPGDNPLFHRFEGLSSSARATCELVCLAGHELSREEIASAANVLGEPMNLDEALAAGVLSESDFDSAVMPQHAFLAQAIINTVSPSRSRAVLRALAAVTTGYRSLRHTLLGAKQWDDNLRTRVNDFLLTATREEHFESTSEVLRAALDLASKPESRIELIESLALIHLRAKTGYLVLDLLDEIEHFPPSILHEFIYIAISAHQVGRELPMERVERLLASSASTPDERAIVAFFAFVSVVFGMRSKDLTIVPTLIAHAKRLVEQAPSKASELTDPRLEWMVDTAARVVVLDCYLMIQHKMQANMDSVAQAIPSLTLRTQDLPDGPLKVDALVAVAGAQIAIGDINQGRALAEQSVELLQRVSEPWAPSTARLILADCLVLQGELTEAIDLIQRSEEVTYRSLDVEARSSWAALKIIIGAITGKELAPLDAERTRRLQAMTWEGYGPDLAILAECELARVHGDFDGVLRASSGRWADRVANTRHGFLTYRAHALLETGQLREADVLIQRLSDWRGTRWQEYWGTLDWLRARRAEIAGDDETAQWHYEAAIENRSFPLPLGLTLADFGKFLQRHEQNGGTQVLKSAVHILEKIGAEGYLPAIRRATGVRTHEQFRPDREQLFGALTERERQIVEHLAKGRSNNQIAESLVVSVTTVRSHVSNVLRKLHVSSRGEINRLLFQEPISND